MSAATGLGDGVPNDKVVVEFLIEFEAKRIRP
jgi:hypothetical protein